MLVKIGYKKWNLRFLDEKGRVMQSSEAPAEPSQTSKMEIFFGENNDRKSLTAFVKDLF